MPEIIEISIFRLDELCEDAKEEARRWYREGAFDHDWYVFVYEDFERVCDILGLELASVPVRLIGGGTRRKPCIWFSGFWSQGDGACFEGQWSHARGSVQAIRGYAPADEELHRIAGVLGAVQRRNFYQLRARVSHRGRHYHEHSMDIAVERDSPVLQAMTSDAADLVDDALRDLARWLYGRLEAEHEYLSSDAVVDAAILANGYRFTATGELAG